LTTTTTTTTTTTKFFLHEKVQNTRENTEEEEDPPIDTTTSKQSSHAPTNTSRGSRRLVRRKKKDRCKRRRHHKAGRRSTAKETMAANTDATTIGNNPWRARYPEPQTSAYKLQMVGAVQTTEDEEEAGGTELSTERAKEEIAGRVGNKKPLHQQPPSSWVASPPQESSRFLHPRPIYPRMYTHLLVFHGCIHDAAIIL
jgi:hypothetical protein